MLIIICQNVVNIRENKYLSLIKKNIMKKTKSIVAVLIVIIFTILTLTSCKNSCKKDGDCSKSKKECCKKPCCDKCSDACTLENKCCDKCKKVEKAACCKKDSTEAISATTNINAEKTCCKETTTPCCDKCDGKCTPEKKCCDKCEA
jgi:hypothetical protein